MSNNLIRDDKIALVISLIGSILMLIIYPRIMIIDSTITIPFELFSDYDILIYFIILTILITAYMILTYAIKGDNKATE